MTYADHVLLQFGGDIGTTEIWSMGIRLASSIAPDGLVAHGESWLPDLAEDVEAFVERTSSHLSSDIKLRYVKCNAIGPDGLYKDQENTNVVFFDQDPPQGPDGRQLPNQIACVVTLETAAQRGRASKGRLYVPALSAAIDGATGFFNGSHANDVMNSVRTLLQDINNTPGADIGSPEVHVYSNLGDPGPHRLVTHVSCDQRPDVQRRRANQLEAPRTRNNVT